MSNEVQAETRTVYVKYEVPVFAKVTISADPNQPATLDRVIVYDEALSDEVSYEDEDGAGMELNEAELLRLNGALNGEWPAWEFGW